MKLRQLFEQAPAKKIVAVMPGGFHPFHPGHKSLYDWAVETFGRENVYVAATDDTKSRPFPFDIKKKLASMAGVPANRFIQVKSPFNALSYKDIITDAENTALVFVRSEKDKTSHPLPDQVRKSDGNMGYLISYKDGDLETADTHGYLAYGPTIDFDFSGMSIKSASELRAAWPEMSDEDKLQAADLMYPGNGETAAQLLNQALGVKELEPTEDASPEEEDEFHRKLDNLVHKFFGHSSDEKKKMKESNLVLDKSRLRSHIISLIADKIAETDDIDQLADWLKYIVGKDLTPRGTRYQITGEDIAEAINECKHGRYWCSTDNKYKCRKGPKQTRESVKKIVDNISLQLETEVNPEQMLNDFAKHYTAYRIRKNEADPNAAGVRTKRVANPKMKQIIAQHLQKAQALEKQLIQMGYEKQVAAIKNKKVTAAKPNTFDQDI